MFDVYFKKITEEIWKTSETEPGMKYRGNRSHNIRALELYLIFKIKTALFYMATELFTQKNGSGYM